MKGKRVFYTKLPTRTGWQSVSTGTRDRDTAKAIERMLHDLGPRGRRDWELLDAVADHRLPIGDLFDAWRANHLDRVRTMLGDVDLEPAVARWLRSKAGNIADDTRAHYAMHLRTLIPEGEPFPRSRFTADRCDEWLAGLEVASGTRRKYYTAASQFGDYCVRTLKVLSTNPLRDVDVPKAGPPRVLFLELADVRLLVDAVPEPYRSLFALLYGSAIEISTALTLRARDVNRSSREIHARGTKGVRGVRAYRDRIVRVAEWAWPQVERLVADKLPEAPLFPGLNRWTVSDEHRAACQRLGFAGYRLHDARHHWAVRAMRAGAPAEIVARQLGHADATLVLRVYGKWSPGAVEREKWEQIAAAQDRVQAKKPGADGPNPATGAEVSGEV